MRYPWEEFLFKLKKNGADLAGLHTTGLLQSFYVYLTDECFRGTPEDMVHLRKALKQKIKTLDCGNTMYREQRELFHRLRRNAKRALRLLAFVEKKKGVWWSENPDTASANSVWVSRDVIDSVISVQKILDKMATHNGGRRM